MDMLFSFVHLAFNLAHRVTLCKICSFIVQLLAFSDRNFNLRSTLFQIDTKRDDRYAFLPHLIPETVDFALVQK